MPTFLRENQVLKNRYFKVPEKLMTHLKQTMATYGDSNSTSKGYKRLSKLVDSNYNDRSNGKNTYDGTALSYGDMKTIKHDFDKMGSNDSLQKTLNGGEEFRQWVNSTLDKERTAVKPIVDANARKNQANAQVKPTKNVNKVPTINGDDVRIRESKKRLILTKEQIEQLRNVL